MRKKKFRKDRFIYIDHNNEKLGKLLNGFFLTILHRNTYSWYQLYIKIKHTRDFSYSFSIELDCIFDFPDIEMYYYKRFKKTRKCIL